MRSEQEIALAIKRYSDTVMRLATVQLKNHSDAEDVFQTVFMKYALSSPDFESESHEKAWLIRVTVNTCKDVLKSFFRSRSVPLEEITEQASEMSEDNREVLEAVMSLPKKYRDVVYLHFYEDYTAAEISQILDKNVNTVYTLITRGKKLLKEKLGGEKYAR